MKLIYLYIIDFENILYHFIKSVMFLVQDNTILPDCKYNKVEILAI